MSNLIDQIYEDLRMAEGLMCWASVSARDIPFDDVVVERLQWYIDNHPDNRGIVPCQ